MSAFNVSLEAALNGSDEDSCNSDGGSINKNKTEVTTVDSCVQPDKILEDLVINNDVYAPRKFHSWQRRRKGYYPPRRFESWHGMTDVDNEKSSESEKQSDSNNVSELQMKSRRAFEKRGLQFYKPGESDVENRQTTETDSVKEEIPDFQLAINTFDERFFGKPQTFDIKDQSSFVPLGMIGVYEARNLFADTRPKLLQATDHQEQLLEVELLIPDADYETEKTPDNEYDGKKFEELFEKNFKRSYLTALGIPEITDSSQIELTTYELENFQKNYMIIFNHENFLCERKRRGTALDVAALENTFKQFRFDVTTHNDLTENDLFLEIRKFSRKDFSASGCICVAILTHGQDNGYLRAFDTRYCERDVIACFDARLNPSLVGKPIIFLIQACRGRHPASVVDAQCIGSTLPVQTVELDSVYPTERHRRPMDSDIIMFHSSFFGRASIRVVEEGTWFIQTLCEQIRLHGATDHLEKLCRRVRTIVAHMEYEGAKQMPVVTSTLLKKLYLKKTLSSSDLDEIWSNALTKTLALMPRHRRKLFDSIRSRQNRQTNLFKSFFPVPSS